MGVKKELINKILLGNLLSHKITHPQSFSKRIYLKKIAGRFLAYLNCGENLLEIRYVQV